MILLPLVAGVVTWSLLEYFIHRFLGHEPKLRPNLFATEHIRHHSEGNYFAEWWKKLLAAAAFVALVSWPVIALMGATSGLAYLSGLMGFYAFYEVLHRREHTCAGFGAYGRWARGHHFAHHYSDTRFNHGVTSPLWDVVFRTYRPVQTIRVPRKFVMPWLKDPLTGEVRADFADRFVVAK
jgi:sterol desaturase/sphingolipid hydroxylase (fatty acid hydroxylase superfamily)